jgi:hypothetical protein
MRAKNLNSEHVEGRVYEHELAIKTVQSKDSANFGKEFISGTIDVATNENPDEMNIVQVHFTFVTETTKKGAKNATFTALKKIIEEGKTWVGDGQEAATKVKIDTALGLNDFYLEDDTLVSQKVNEGGFVTIVNSLNEDVAARSTWEADMVIMNITKVEADAEKNISAPFVRVGGIVFDFRNAALPMEYVAEDPKAIAWFEKQDVSQANPIFTKVWGQLDCKNTIVERTEESAFGEPTVKKYTRKTKKWLLTNLSPNFYDFGDEKVMTMDDLQKASQDRQTYLAGVKKRAEEYKAQKANGGAPTANANPAPAASSIPVGNFKF